MSLKLDLFKIFKTVSDCNSISIAAHRLFISQPAVSQSIKQLEESMGITLFVRTKKGVFKTKEGEILYDYVSKAMDLIEQGQNKIDNFKNLDEGELIIAASDTISQHLLLNPLEEFHKSYPNLKIKIVNRTSIESVALLKSAQVDIAFLNLPIEDKNLNIIPLVTIQDIFIAQKDCFNYFGKTYKLKELKEMKLILLEQKSSSRIYVENYLKDEGIIIMPEIELGSHGLIIDLVKIGLGVGCVIKEFVTNQLDSGEIVELNFTKKIPKRKIGIALLDGVQITKPSEKFISICKDMIIKSN